MSGAEEFERLFGEAEENLKRQEVPETWGPMRATEEGERLLTRYVGRDELPPYFDVVFRFVGYPDGQPFYLRRVAQLEQVLEGVSVGSIVGLVRGRDKDVGRERPMQTWSGWARPCDEPLVAPAAKPAADDDDGIPF